jgi:ElaB/YqjD/DUF883 family membrane-anchored ribosome-binding protein
MPNTVTSVGSRRPNDPSTGGDRLSDTAGQVKDTLSDLSRTAVNTIDENRRAAAGGLDKAASALHEKADDLPGGETVSNLAHTAADHMHSTAGYVRDHDVNRMLADVETLVKNSPGVALLVAAAFGFLVGRAFSHD